MAAITTAHGPPPAGPVVPAPAQGADSAGPATFSRDGLAVASSSQHTRLPPPIVTDFAYPVKQAREGSRADKDAPVCKQDLPSTSPSSSARAPASPRKHAYHYKHPDPAPKRLLKRLGSLIHPHHRDPRKRSSKSHPSSARSSRPASLVHSTPATGTGTPLVSEPESLLPPTPATASAPPDAIRPCIKVRIVTFNMHDSLPACEGDLSDFLGDINEFPEEHLRRPPKKRGSSHSSMGGRSRASSSKGSTLTMPVANDVLPTFPLTEGHPYHILVVCGQECPTASGMFAGKRRAPDGKGWTSILEDYLCGGCSHDSDSESGMSSSDDFAEREHEASDPASAAVPSSAASTDDLASSAHVLTDTASIASHATANGSRGASLSASPHRRARAPYVLVEKERLMGIYCAVFVARCCEDLVEGVSKGRVTAGLMGGRVGNKGGVGISLHFASTRLLFISAHLAAHASGLEFRKANTTKILDELVIDDFWESSGKMGPKPKQLIDRLDSVFFAGDLNFRLNISRLHADWLVRGKDYVTALRFDQLRDVLAESSGVFRGFREGAIDFPPTYKYDIVHPKIHKRRSTLLRGPGSKLTKRNSRADLKSPSLSVAADFDAASNSGSLTDPEVMPASATTTPIPCADDDALSVISSVGTISTLDTTADDDAAGAEFGILGRSELNKADLKSLGLPKPPSKGAETSMDAVRKAQVRFLTLVKSNSNAAAMEYAKQQKDAKEGTSAGRAGRDRASSTARPRLNGLFAPRPILQASQSAMVVPTTTITAPEADASGDETIPDGLGAEDTAQEPVFDSSKKQRVQSWTDRILFHSSNAPDDEPPLSTRAPTPSTSSFPPPDIDDSGTPDTVVSRPASADGARHLRFDRETFIRPGFKSASSDSVAAPPIDDERSAPPRFERTRSLGPPSLHRRSSQGESTRSTGSADAAPSTSIWKRVKSSQLLSSVFDSTSSIADSPLQSPGLSGATSAPVTPVSATAPTPFQRRTPRKKFTLSGSPTSSDEDLGRLRVDVEADAAVRPALSRPVSDPATTIGTSNDAAASDAPAAAGARPSGDPFPRSRSVSAALGRLHDRDHAIGHALSASNASLNSRFKSFLSLLPLPFLSTSARISGPLATRAPPALPKVGPRPGEIQVLKYDSVRNLAKMGAVSDHRPVYLVCAVGVDGLAAEDGQ